MTSRFGVFSKMLFLLFLLLAGSVNGYGQSMTEGQIIQFVQQEQQKGSDQQTIVAKLLQKGVTVEQLRNIRKKYEAQKSQLGAVNLQEPVRNSNNTAGRMRTKKETEQERLNRQNGYMIRSQREELEEKGMSRADRQNALNDEIAFMDIDSLIYYQNHFQKDGTFIPTCNQVIMCFVLDADMKVENGDPSQSIRSPLLARGGVHGGHTLSIYS